MNTHHCVLDLGVHDEGPVLVGDQTRVLRPEHVRQRRLSPSRVPDPVRQTTVALWGDTYMMSAVGEGERGGYPKSR